MKLFNWVYFREAQGREPCPVDPFYIVPERCQCVDFQTLKLQESPDAVPQVVLDFGSCDVYL